MDADGGALTTIARTAALLADVFPGTRLARTDYLEWLYLKSPFGPVVETNLDDDRGRIGHYALVPIALTQDGLPQQGALSLNTAVHERARGGGTFVRLASETLFRGAETRDQCRGGRSQRKLDSWLPAAPGVRADWATARQRAASIPWTHAGVSQRLGESDGFLDRRHRRGPGTPARCAGDRVHSGVDHRDAALAAGSAGRALCATPQWGVLAVTCMDRRYGVRVAILLKVFASSPVPSGVRRALVSAACRLHRAPLALHVGLNDLVDFRGIPLPGRLRGSPLNLIYLSLEDQARPVSIVRFEFLDFDAY